MDAQSVLHDIAEMPKKRKLLLYADDPGAVNYLASLPATLSAAGFLVEFVVAPALANYVADRQIACEVRRESLLPEEMIATSDGLVIGTSEDPRCFGHALVAAARCKGIPSLGVVDMEVNAAGRFRGESENPLQHAPGFLAVPDKSCRDAYIKLGFPANHILVCGHPHYDFVRARREDFLIQDRQAIRRSVFPTAPIDRSVWLFLAEGIDQLNPVVSYRSPDYTLSGRGISDFRAAIVLEEVLDVTAAMHPRPYVVLRLHPKSIPEDFSAYASELGSISLGGDPLPLVWAADFVIGMTSMLLLEAYILGKPVLSIIPRLKEKEWLSALRAGMIPCATNRYEISEQLEQLLDIDIAQKSGEFAFLPGASARIVDYVSAMLDGDSFRKGYVAVQ